MRSHRLTLCGTVLAAFLATACRDGSTPTAGVGPTPSFGAGGAPEASGVVVRLPEHLRVQLLRFPARSGGIRRHA